MTTPIVSPTVPSNVSTTLFSLPNEPSRPALWPEPRLDDAMPTANRLGDSKATLETLLRNGIDDEALTRARSERFKAKLLGLLLDDVGDSPSTERAHGAGNAPHARESDPTSGKASSGGDALRLMQDFGRRSAQSLLEGSASSMTPQRLRATLQSVLPILNAATSGTNGVHRWGFMHGVADALRPLTPMPTGNWTPRDEQRVIAAYLELLVFGTVATSALRIGGDALLKPALLTDDASQMRSLFAAAVRQRVGLEEGVIQWVVREVLAYWVPALSRDDLPTGLAYGSLEWADLSRGIDVCRKTKVDSASLSIAELQTIARQDEIEYRRSMKAAPSTSELGMAYAVFRRDEALLGALAKGLAQVSSAASTDPQIIARSRIAGAIVQEAQRQGFERTFGAALSARWDDQMGRLLPAVVRLRNLMAHQPPSRRELATTLVATGVGANSHQFAHSVEAYLATPRRIAPPFELPVLDDAYAAQWASFGDALGSVLGELFDERIRQAASSDGFSMLRGVGLEHMQMLIPKVVYRGSGDTFGGMHFTKEWDHAAKVDHIVLKVGAADGKDASPTYVMLRLEDLLNDGWPRSFSDPLSTRAVSFDPAKSKSVDALIADHKQTLFEPDALDDMGNGADSMRWTSTPWAGSGKPTTIGGALGEYFGHVVARELAARSYEETSLQKFNQKAADFVSGLKCMVPLWCGIEASMAGKRAEAVAHFMTDLANVCTLFVGGAAEGVGEGAGVLRSTLEGAAEHDAGGGTELSDVEALLGRGKDAGAIDLDVHDANAVDNGGVRRVEEVADGTMRSSGDTPLRLRGGFVHRGLEPLRFPGPIEVAFEVDALNHNMSVALVQRIRQAYHYGATTLDLSEIALNRIPPWLPPSGVETLILRPSANFVIDPLKLTGMNTLRLVGADMIELSTLTQHDLLALPTLTSIEIADAPNLTHVDLFSVRAGTLRVSNAPLLESLSHNAGGLTRVELSGLPKLDRLSLRQNSLVHDSVAVAGESALEGLNILDLADNKLESVPDAVEQMPKLRSIYMNNNELSSLGHLVQAPNLEMINVAYNKFSELPVYLACRDKLLEYSASGNQITRLEPAISQFEQLTKLSLSDNRLTDLPNEMTGLTHLRELHLDGNPFVGQPAVLEHLLPQLDASRSRLPW